MSEEEKILKTIRYCANDYMKQEDGIQCFEWGDLWVLNEYIDKLQQENQQLKDVIEKVNNIIEKKKRTLGYDTNDSYLRSIEEILDKVKDNKK